MLVSFLCFVLVQRWGAVQMISDLAASCFSLGGKAGLYHRERFVPQVWPLLSFCCLRSVVFIIICFQLLFLSFLSSPATNIFSFFLFSSVQGTKELLFLRQL